MKITLSSTEEDEVIDDSFHGTLLIESGEAVYMIREVDSERIVVLCPSNDPGEPVHRMLIEPVSSRSFQVTQFILKPRGYDDDK